ncbi:MAG: NUDIX domain-containing protein [Candidatus Paracaedimonas acanthamoebae]|uniref:NUDIX domain-containing protein n=1 Tax=Candidatus Paracaedimonas acanthamoebae TaxID=244581 RepID=A0A8J7TVN3_9PROT|nr:NUDIX domain-containing protein [Candidatus Paracaedimonas acanthamoebae]
MLEKNRFKIPVAPHLILLKGDQVLLHLRQNTGYADGMYSLVAGHLEGGESILQAMIREAREEANIEIDPTDLSVNCTMHRWSRSGEEYIYLYLICRRWKGQLRNREPEKCKELQFHPLDNLPSNLLPAVRRGIECALNEISYCEYGWEEK